MPAVWPSRRMSHDPKLARREAVALIELASFGEPEDPWLLPEDGTTDTRAVEAVIGGRRVKLTRRERLVAATLILEEGLTANEVCHRLALPRSVEVVWKTDGLCINIAKP